jgi:hypothetical protein
MVPILDTLVMGELVDGEGRRDSPFSRSLADLVRRAVQEDFDPIQLIGRFDGDLEQAVNACVECCDRHVGTNAVALVSVNAVGERAGTKFQTWLKPSHEPRHAHVV